MTVSSTDIRAIQIDIDALRVMAARIRTSSSEDSDMLLATIESIIALKHLVYERGSTVARLRRLFHLSNSEKTAGVVGDTAPESITLSAKDPSSEEASTSESDDDVSRLEPKKGKNKGTHTGQGLQGREVDPGEALGAHARIDLSCV